LGHGEKAAGIGADQINLRSWPAVAKGA